MPEFERDSFSLDSVITTSDLDTRPARAPDYKSENEALIALAHGLANSPETILHRLAETALSVCRAQSAGISLLEQDRETKLFRWHAIVGQWAKYAWGTAPREHSPCGTVLDRNHTLLFSKPERAYPMLVEMCPSVSEGLLVPFFVMEKTVGTIWVVMHDESYKFDSEDRRLLENLGKFAATAYRANLTIAEFTRTNESLKAEIAGRKRIEEELHQSEDRLRDQSKLLEQQLIASGRLVSLGEVSASMAHEFNNPLGIILGFIEHLLEESPSTDTNHQDLQIIHEEAKRCQKIVSDLMEFARPTSAAFGSVSVARAITNSLRLIENRLYKQKIISENHIETGLPAVHGDTQQLEQVLVNVYLNAIDAMPNGGKLTVEARQAHKGGSSREIVITVADTGIGISTSDLQRIFQPFFSAHKQRGMGLGLSICERIIKNHGGRIEVESEPGKSTSFKIHLPCATSP